jgi:hypothetical protein
LSSADLTPEEFRRIRRRALDLTTVTVGVMVVGIVILALYTIVLVGSLTSPGAQESLGLALALAFIMAAVASHEVDRLYRLWPMGRRVHPVAPGPVTVADQTRFLKALVLILTAAAIAYLLGALIAG